MRPLARLAVALAVIALQPSSRAGAEPHAAGEPPNFSAMSDDLLRLQTRIAEGDRSAYPAEVAELTAMAAAIAAAPPETWAGKREAGSLVIYMLSGGALAPVVPSSRKTRSLFRSGRWPAARSPMSPTTRPTRSSCSPLSISPRSTSGLRDRSLSRDRC
jgi:hypothetical protein